MPNFIRVAKVNKGKVGIGECPLLDSTVGNPFIRAGLDGFREVTADIHKTRTRKVAQLLPVEKECCA